MSDDWPPEWEDLEEFPEGADQLDAEAEGRLSGVTAYLASLPDPVLPDAVEARISAALAAEADARAGGHEQADDLSPASDAAGAAQADGARPLRPTPSRARVRRRRSVDAGHRALRSRPLMAVGAAIACLALAGLGYGLSRGGPSGMSSSASSAAGSAARSSAAAAPEASAPMQAASPSSGSVAAGLRFEVTKSGTKYLAATLAAQARANVAAAPNPGSAKSAPTSDFNLSSTPTAALRGCVAHLTGGRPPQLADLATYQGKPAYIIVGSTKVWVVGLGCTAGNPELIASVPLGS